MFQRTPCPHLYYFNPARIGGRRGVNWAAASQVGTAKGKFTSKFFLNCKIHSKIKIHFFSPVVHIGPQLLVFMMQFFQAKVDQIIANFKCHFS